MTRDLPPGIVSGGLWLIDSTKYIDAYPSPSGLAKISQTVVSNGGGAFNLLVDLARLGASFPLVGIGLVGDDAPGAWILEQCRRHRIATDQIRRAPGAATAFTDVMTEAGSGRRTFFYSPAANERLGREHFDFSSVRGRIFYLGYPGLIPRLDAPDNSGRSGIDGLLEEAKAHGYLTAVDLVSADSGHWESLRTALPRVDVLFANEWEAAKLLGESPVDDATLSSALLVRYATALLERTRGHAVVVHAGPGAVCASAGGSTEVRGGVQVADDEIRGTCGAGDALAAGFLFGLHEGFGWSGCLELGVCAAATCLHDLTSSGGIRAWQSCLDYGRARGFRAF